jgi:hypothetical protein
MAIPKGKSGNPAGKPKGVQNKVTLEVKEKINVFLDNNIDVATKAFNDIKTPEMKIKYFIELAKLVMPRPKDPDEEEDANRRHDELLDRLFNRKSD